MIALRRKVRITLSRLLYLLCSLAMYHILVNTLEYNTNQRLPVLHFPFEGLFSLYLSWAVLILGGILLLNLRKNLYHRIFAVFSVLIGFYWIVVLLSSG